MTRIQAGHALTVLFTVTLLFIGALASSTEAQSPHRYQIEASADRGGPQYLYSVHLVYADREYLMSQETDVKFSGAVTRLTPIAGRWTVRYGLSVTDKGYREDHSEVFFGTGARTESQRNISLLYAGIPVTLGFNASRPGAGLELFLEAGLLPERLVYREESDYLNYDLRSMGLTYLVSPGLSYNLRGGRSLIVAPEVRMSAMDYARSEEPKDMSWLPEYRHFSTSIRFGVQF